MPLTWSPRVLLEPGDCVAVEDPGYVPAVRLFGALGANVVGVPGDDQGLVVDQLPASAGSSTSRHRISIPSA